MPASVLVPAALGAGSQIFGTIMSNKANNKAMNQQQSANQSAMLFERQKYEEDRKWRQWAREELGRRFGFTPPSMGGSGGTLGDIGGMPGRVVPASVRNTHPMAPRGPVNHYEDEVPEEVVE